MDPLYMAALYQKPEIVKLLLNTQDVDVNAKSDWYVIFTFN